MSTNIERRELTSWRQLAAEIYAAGLVLTYGNIAPEYYEDPYLHDARLLDLVGRIKVMPSEEADRTENEFNLCETEVVLKSGSRKLTRVEYHRCHFKNPTTDAEMEEKFRLTAQKHLPQVASTICSACSGASRTSPTWAG